MSAVSAAMAEPVNGTYVLGGGGLNWLRDADTGSAGTYQFDTGWTGIGALGYGFNNGFRVESELGYRRNHADNASGEMNAWSLMANGLYDFDIGSKITPYAGIGLGLARIQANNLSEPGSTARIDDSDPVFAYQGLAGVLYPLSDGLKLDFGYRYFSTETPEFTDSAGRSFGSQYRDHTVLMSLRYEFK